MYNELPGKLMYHLNQASNADDAMKLVKQALDHFKDTRDPTLVKEVKSTLS